MPYNPDRARELFEQTDAVVTNGHFVYVSGLHGDAYANKDAVYADPPATFELSGMIADIFKDRDIQTVVGPEKGAIILSFATALHLSQLTGRKVNGIYAEKQPGENPGDPETFGFKRGYEAFVPGRRILIVEDVVNTGGSINKVIDAVKALGGEIVGVGALCNRGGVKSKELGGVDLEALMNIQMKTYPPDNCPLCESGVPINTKLGKGKQFLASQSQTA